ncbi:MAG: PAS domain S-box protein [Spirochaetes bacterium]|nr:PAS domain S-box protein [Spirochaetota bacterium]
MNRILIVDDNEANLYLLQALLEGHGYTIENACNGGEAIVKAVKNPPDIIITDILMPVIDGFTLCRIWKNDEHLSKIPFIFYTATYTDPRDEQLALDMGADAFIIKPEEPGEFLRKVESILELRKEGKLASPEKPKAGEDIIYKNYNETLVRKLEHKMLVLEQTNNELEAEISARKEAEKALRESEERYRLLFENSMDGVLLTEPNGTILKANPEACRLFGRSEDEICKLGRSGIVDTSDLRLQHAIEERDRTGRFSGEMNCIRKDGTPFPCEVSSAMFKDNEGKVKTSMIIRDITERKQAESEIVAALHEKNVLLKEIHHRVKNNMQIMSSLISIQMHADNSVSTPDDNIEIVRELQNRIMSMALVHEMLYNSNNLSKINFNEYIRNLSGSLLSVYKISPGQVNLSIEVSDKPISITTAIPLGLLINELLTNVLKYAFPSGRKGEIRICMTIDDEGWFHLTVRDNGIGLPDDFNIDTEHSLGMRLLSVLIAQLHGSIDVHNDNGAVFTAQFREISDNNLSTLQK